MGERGWLRALQPRHGAAVRTREPPARPHLEPHGCAPVQAHGELLQLSGAAGLQAEVRPGVGAPVPRLSRRPRAAQDPHERLGPRLTRPAGCDLEVTPRRNLVVAACTASVALTPVVPRVARAQAGGLKDLPLVEVVAPRPVPVFAVLFSGDGGWAPMDRAIAAALQGHGISVVGINAMKYLWHTRTPEGAGADMGRIVRHYLDAWKADSVILIGYSRGAGVVPFMVNRMDDDLRVHVRLIALLGAEH